jgi:cell wall-associated NlpC family hydrolase
MPHWAEAYVGMPFVLGEYDCASLAVQVRREVFKRPVPDGLERERAASTLGRCRQMADGMADYGVRTTTPAEGDLVLMRCLGRPSHVGVYCVVDGEPTVLHALRKPGMAMLTSIRRLPAINLALEGYYQWK